MMTDKYQARCLETWHTDKTSPINQQIHATLGLVGEAGEVAEMLKKIIYKPGHHTTTRTQRLNELGDVFYYLCILTHLDGCSINELSEMNYRKLQGGHGWKPDHMNNKQTLHHE